MATTSMLKATGLHTFNNYLSSVPEGALLVADNTIIDKDGTIEPRRGIRQYGVIGTTSADIARQFLIYKDRILAHYSDTIAWDNGSGTFTNYTESFAVADSGLRLKYVESNGNLYVTTGEGVKKIATNSQANLGSAVIGDAGGIKAITGTATCDYTVEGFLDGYSKVAYRITWITTDINGNLIEGTPSPAIEVTNQSPQSAKVSLTFQVPNGITTDYSYRIYRTNVARQSGTPTFEGIAALETGDEMRLVIESPYVTGTSIAVLDETPEDFRNNGVNLYTNEFSGEGINQANEPPPYARDIALYKNAVFYANTRTRHFIQIALLGLGAFKSYGGLQDSIDITGMTYLAPDTTITFDAPHGMTIGTRIVIMESGDPAFDGIHEITDVPNPNEIVIEADSSGASIADMSIYGSSIAIQRGANPANFYYFVGRPEVYTYTFPDKTDIASTGTADYIQAYAAENQASYVFWFKNGTSVEPVITNTIPIEIDITDVGIVTGADIAAKFADVVANNTFDFEVIGTIGAAATVRTGNSGAATDSTTSNPLILVNKDQNGHGEDTTKGYIRLSTYVSPAQSIDDTARSLAKVITSNPTEVVNAFYLFIPDGLPGNFYLQARDLSTEPFTITASDAAAGELFNPNLSSPVVSSNDESPNRIYYSKLNQPEAVPTLNYQNVGPRDKKILRIVALRDSLFILKEEAVYRLTGDSSTNYSITIFDNSANLIAPDSAVVLNNQIYCLTTQGVTTISETGVSIISRPIESTINTISSPAFVNYKTITFGVGYESDRSYILWVPTIPVDETATRAFRFNTFTQTWTSWSVGANCGIVEPTLNRLYTGATDTNLVEIERKDLTRDDYTDRQYDLQIPADAIENDVITISSGALVRPGDMLVQTQYVTIAQVIRVARKLVFDTAISVAQKPYYEAFDIPVGVDLPSYTTALFTQLNADIGSTFNTVFSADSLTFQGEFNDVIDDMNASPLLNQANYKPAVGNSPFELLVEEKVGPNEIKVLAIPPLVQGNIVHYKAIQSEVVWAPLYFGDPSLYKHIRQGTVLFDNAGIAFATIGYNSDLSPNFEDIAFLLEGDGSWGGFFFSHTTWGGEGSARPFRTLIPRQKQRCRFIRARFKHSTAFYRYAILGISYTYEIYSERAYK